MAGLAVLSAEGLRNYILEGVDNLRIRKCRPDRETIAHYVLRKYGGTINDIFNELETIVDEGLLLKVEYKGSTSYRTPESFDQKNSPLLTKHSKILNSSRTTRLILTTINDLLVQNPDYCTLGIPLSELKEKLTGQEPERFADNKLDIAFSREVSIGNVLLGDGDRVYPKDIQPRRSQVASNGSPSPAAGDKLTETTTGPANELVKVPKKRGRKSNAERLAIAQAQAAASGSSGDSTLPVSDETKLNTVDPKTVAAAGEAKIEEKVAEAVRKTFDGRVSGRNKIKRKVFDPSDVPTPTPASKAASSIKKKKRSSSNQDSVDTCEICNRKGDVKNLIICSSCAASYHTTCLGFTKEKQATINLSDWLCYDCRICNACSSPLKSSNHVECVKCKSGFHTVCVGDEEDFICGECVFNKGNVKNGKEQNQVPGQVAPQAGQAPTPPAKKRGRPPKIRKVEDSTVTAASVITSPPSTTTASPTLASAPVSQSTTQTTTPTKAAGTLTSTSTSTSTDPKSSPAKATLIAPSDVKEESVPVPKLGLVDSSASTSSASASASAGASTSTVDPVSQEKKPVIKDEEPASGTVAGQSGVASASAALKTEGSQTADNLDDDNNIVDDSIVIGEGKPSDLEAKKCSEWTPADVEKYFNDKGLPEAGTLFREQEVDGLSLLLMKRSDVIFGLRLRLGPALKVYKIILQLQNNLTT